MSTHIDCHECGTTYEVWNAYDQKCNAKHWQDNFKNWTSESEDIDNLIQQSQRNANKDYEIIEWIDSSKFANIQLIADGKMYKAIWKNGPITNYYEEEPGDYSMHYYSFFWNDKGSAWNS